MQYLKNPALILIFSLVLTSAAEASRASTLLRLIYRESPEAVAQSIRQADERIVEAAFRRIGTESVERVFREGGFAILQAARTHGDDAITLAGRVPGSARVVAAQADTILPAVRQYGDRILELEMKVSGFHTRATSKLNPAQIKAVLRARPEHQADLARMIMVAENPAVAGELVRLYGRDPLQLMNWLANRRAAIIAGGGVITAVMIDDLVRGENSLFSKGKDGAKSLIWVIMKWVIAVILAIWGIKTLLLYVLKKLFLDWRIRRVKSSSSESCTPHSSPLNGMNCRDNTSLTDESEVCDEIKRISDRR